MVRRLHLPRVARSRRPRCRRRRNTWSAALEPRWKGSETPPDPPGALHWLNGPCGLAIALNPGLTPGLTHSLTPGLTPGLTPSLDLDHTF